ncbi:hypothetical protein GCM10009715_18410 [Paeniglutamicibacter psychrophenolicus]|uniref:Uncharacterized protein (TIGR04255 family) n=1 Tax=Paeniglutamicibacter psychrophenolicus TaxID=257454 RepID=A0ABS4WD08_9MICC|nr:TIGR04255 family protein [Paeniglutamicibacter psychrophenolicus]MBP2374085.1 uncharacterized protein (TIGR04255 family) [Paeniglutamicibacter psychrophenolicus]
MHERERFRPFTGDTSKRILLNDAPLSMVLCQIRWPELGHLQLDMKPRVLEFGSKLSDYPIFQESQEISYTVTPEGVHQGGGGTVFQWRSIDGTWNVSLGRRFLSLYCTDYPGFTIFSERLTKILELLEEHMGVPLIERVGVRYVNQIVDARLIDNLEEYVSPVVLGYSSLVPASPEIMLVSNANQALYSIEDVMLQVRSGMVPADQSVDPAVPAANTESWVLDLDAFNGNVLPFSVPDVLDAVGKLSDTAYDFFKLVVTDGFIREFGGES